MTISVNEHASVGPTGLVLPDPSGFADPIPVSTGNQALDGAPPFPGYELLGTIGTGEATVGATTPTGAEPGIPPPEMPLSLSPAQDHLFQHLSSESGENTAAAAADQLAQMHLTS